MPFGNDSPFPLSDAFIGRTGAVRGYMQDFMKARASKTRSFETFDFNVKALDTTNQWTVAAGATATTWAVRGEAGGWIRGVSGTTAATSGLQLSIPTSYFTGTSNAGVAFLWRPSVITETRFELGFVNALPSVNTNVVNSLATPTFNTTATAALFVFDHTGSTTTAGLYTDGSAVAAQKTALTTQLPVAATTHFVAIEVIGQTVMLWLNDVSAPVATLTSAVTAADALIPVFAHKKSDTTTSNVDIDTIWTWSARV